MPTIVHLDIAADEVERAKKFYQNLFGWPMDMPPGMADYYLFQTNDLEGKPGIGGGLGKRGEPGQRITTYFGVSSVDEYAIKVQKAGGKVLQQKMPVPGWGYLTTCQDTENNVFGLWQEDKTAK
jgi:uncharacterized protein